MAEARVTSREIQSAALIKSVVPGHKCRCKEPVQPYSACGNRFVTPVIIKTAAGFSSQPAGFDILNK